MQKYPPGSNYQKGIDKSERIKEIRDALNLAPDQKSKKHWQIVEL